MGFYIELGFHATTHRVAFGDDKVAAERELAALVPKLGKDPLERFDRNSKYEDTHTIVSPTGDTVVVPAKIQVARVLDGTLWNDLVGPDDDRLRERDIEWAVRKKKALAEVTAEPVS